MATIQNGSQRGVAMVLSLVSAIVLSPLYIKRRGNSGYYEAKWSSSGRGFVLPMLLAGLIIAIKSTSVTRGAKPSSSSHGSSQDPSRVLRIGSSWGLACVLVMLMLLVSWQHSVQQFFWR